MANYTGYITGSILSGASASRASFFDTSLTWPLSGEAFYITLGVSGSYSVGSPIAPSRGSYSGQLAPTFTELFYNRIYVTPTSISAGSLVSSQSYTISIFNAYLTSKSLSNIDDSGLDAGMTISETSPLTLYALQEKQYTLTITLRGPFQIDAEIVYTIDGEDYTVTVTGVRATLLPIVFRSNIVETLVWSTDILESFDGSEQRIQVRLTPRQQLKITAYLSYEEMRRLEDRVIGNRQRSWAFPMWIEARTASAAVPSGSLTASVSTLYGDFRVDGFALVWENSSKYDIMTVTGITDTTLTFGSEVANNYTSPPIIMPIRTAIFTSDPKRMTTGYNGGFTCDVEITDNVSLDTSASDTQFLGEDFFDMIPLYEEGGEGITDEYVRRIDRFDYEPNAVSIYSPWDITKKDRSFEAVLEGLQEIWEHRLWLHRRAGRLRPFYMATHEADLKVITTGTILDTLTVQSDSLAIYSSERIHLLFRLTDGSLVFRTITGLEATTDNTSIITLDSALSIDASLIDEINFVGLQRLTSDRQSFTWLPNNVALTSLKIREIEH